LIGKERWEDWRERKIRIGELYGLVHKGRQRLKITREYGWKKEDIKWNRESRLKQLFKELIVKKKSRLLAKGLRYLGRKKRTKELWGKRIEDIGSYVLERGNWDKKRYNYRALKWWDSAPTLEEQKKRYKELENKIWVPNELLDEIKKELSKKRLGLPEEKWIKSIEENNIKFIKKN